MTITADRIMTNGGQDLPLQRDVRDALSTYARHQWPRDTAKHASRAWQVPLTTAQNLLKGHASAATITHVLRIAGWEVGLAVIGAVIGHGIDDHFASERKRLRHERRKYEEQDQRLAQAARHLRADRHLGVRRGCELDPPPSRRGVSERR